MYGKDGIYSHNANGSDGYGPNDLWTSFANGVTSVFILNSNDAALGLNLYWGLMKPAFDDATFNAQDGWRRCKQCEGLFYGGGALALEYTFLQRQETSANNWGDAPQ